MENINDPFDIKLPQSVNKNLVLKYRDVIRRTFNNNYEEINKIVLDFNNGINTYNLYSFSLERIVDDYAYILNEINNNDNVNIEIILSGVVTLINNTNEIKPINEKLVNLFNQIVNDDLVENYIFKYFIFLKDNSYMYRLNKLNIRLNYDIAESGYTNEGSQFYEDLAFKSLMDFSKDINRDPSMKVGFYF